MKYKEIKKIEEGLTKIGYSLMNLSTGDALVTRKNGLIVLSKVNKFSYIPKHIVVEIAFEDIVYCMFNFDSSYSFDYDSLHLFLNKFKELDKELYEDLNFEQLKNREKNDDELVTIGLKITDPNLN